MTPDEALAIYNAGPKVVVNAPFLNLCLKSWIELHYMV